jgi:hypothetical protein
MNNVNVCFVSYQHTGDPDAHAFVTAFVSELKTQVSCWSPIRKSISMRTHSRSATSTTRSWRFNFCQSACMVMFFMPLHFDMQHPYCALEYQAMLRLEVQRLGAGVVDLRNRGLIFPVVFHGLDQVDADHACLAHVERKGFRLNNSLHLD